MFRVNYFLCSHISLSPLVQVDRKKYLVFVTDPSHATFQKSTLSENWGHSSRSSSALGGQPGMHGCPPDVSRMKYVIHKQPLSLDRFFLHEVTAAEAAASKLDNCFVLICLNRFQQIVQVHTFQADTEQLKVCAYRVSHWIGSGLL